MISLTLVSDMLQQRSNRELQRHPFDGNRLIDYLPIEARDPDVARLLWVTHNGERLTDRADWLTARLHDGDHIGCAVAPSGIAVSIGLLAATTIVSGWQIYDATRRARIQEHHAARRAASMAVQMGDSPTYGWGGPQNTVNPGSPIPVLLGGPHRVAGQVILGWPQGDGTIDMKVALGQGEVEGLVAGSVEINGKPSSKYPNLTIASRDGTIAQLGLGIYGGASLVTPKNTVSLLISPGGNNAGSYWWGSGVRWFGTGFALNSAGASTLKQTANGSGGTKGTIDGYAVISGIFTGRTVFNRAVNGYVQFHLDIEHRTPQGAGGFTAAGTSISAVARVINGRIASSMLWSFRSQILAVGDYDVQVTLNGSTTVVVADDGAAVALASSGINLILESLREYRVFDRAHPGLAYLGVEGLSAAAVGSMLPTVTSIWEGRKIRDVLTVGPPATFTSEQFLDPSILGLTRGRNPALQILDLLTNTKYGSGEFIDPDEDLDLQSFVDARDFCDTLVSRGLNAFDPIKSGTGDGTTFGATDDFVVAGQTFNDGSVKVDDTLEIFTGADTGVFRIGGIDSATGLSVTTAVAPFLTVAFAGAATADWEIRNTERRCLTDIYFDGVTTIWKAIEAIAEHSRLAVVRSSGMIKLVPDEFGTVVQIFGEGNMDDFKAERGGAIVANRVEVQFLDAEKNFEQSLAAFEDDTVGSSTKTENIVPTQIEAFGVTRRSQATRISKYHWFSNRLEFETVEFVADATALVIEWGDVIQVVHPALPREGIDALPSGRLFDVSGLTAILDDWHTFDITNGHDRFLVQRSDTDAPLFLGLIPIALDGVKTKEITFASFPTYTPRAGDIWVTESSLVDDEQRTLYKVVSITRTEDHRRLIKGVTFEPDLFVDNPVLGTTGVDTIELSEIDP